MLFDVAQMQKHLSAVIELNGQISFLSWNHSHRNKVSKKFKALLKGKRLMCVDISDNNHRMDPDLIRIFESTTWL